MRGALALDDAEIEDIRSRFYPLCEAWRYAA
jgi:hypothetical protein